MSGTLYINKCPPYIMMWGAKGILPSVFLKSNRAGEISPARLLFYVIGKCLRTSDYMKKKCP